MLDEVMRYEKAMKYEVRKDDLGSRSGLVGTGQLRFGCKSLLYFAKGSFRENVQNEWLWSCKRGIL